MQKNGYFQLQMREDGIFVQIFPQKEGGNPLNITEVVAYLDKFKYNQYDLKELNSAIVGTGAVVRVADYKGDSVDEEMDVEVSLDKMLVSVRFYPPSNNGRKLTLESMVSTLQKMNITAPVDKAVLEAFLSDKEYCKIFQVAKGIPPVQGHNARIEYFFNTNPDLKPKRNEDGSVDYKDLNTISHVKAGDRLALLHKEDPGKPGTDVFGGPIKPNPVKPMKLSFANNITLSEDGTEIFSDVTGHVSLVQGKVFVSDVYDVPADVDNSTGNIEYEGNVHVKGNVKGGFSVTAKGDIIVEGVVEDATLNAGGQIIVMRGIHGMAKGVLVAKGNIITKFIENATVKAGGYVETELIMHSNVSAATNVVVNGKKGFVTGGVIRAGNLVEAQTIGSSMGAATEIEVGMPPEAKERMMELSKSLEKKTKDEEQIKPILVTMTTKIAKGEKLSADKMKYVKTLAENYKALQVQMEAEKKELEVLKEKLAQGNKARVVVHKDIFPGSSVMISDVKVFIKAQRSFCQFVKSKGEVDSQNLS